MLLTVYCFVSYMRKKKNTHLFSGVLWVCPGWCQDITCHTTEQIAEGTFHTQRKYHRKATRKVFPQSCNFNLREPQHTPGAYPTPLGSGSGVCSRGMLANSWIQTSNKSKQPQNFHAVIMLLGFFFLITDPWKNTNEQWWTQNGHDMKRPSFQKKTSGVKEKLTKK